nr:MAG TPA: hypothetical protein [Caudoviricetes sp.]
MNSCCLKSYIPMESPCGLACRERTTPRPCSSS